MRRFIAIQSYPRKKRKISYKQHNLTPRRRQWHPTPVLLPGKSQGQRSLVGYSPWGHKESDTTERLHFRSPFLSVYSCHLFLISLLLLGPYHFYLLLCPSLHETCPPLVSLVFWKRSLIFLILLFSSISLH